MHVKSEMLTESKSLRETVIDRMDVLEKVKNLSLMPDGINASTEMVAEYYEVPVKTIQTTITKNKDELKSDGMKVIRGDELTLLKEVSSIPKNAPSFTMIPKRAILRIGMLLQESEIAKAVRSYLLDKEEEKTQLTMPDGLSTEMKMFHLMFVSITRNDQEIAELKQTTGELTTTVKTIQETIVTRDENWRKQMKNLFNAAVFRLGTTHSELRNKSYEMLEERANCNLKTRLTNWHKRLEKQGHSKSKIESVTRMDVIEDDFKLKEIYTSIVKEISIGSLKIAK